MYPQDSARLNAPWAFKPTQLHPSEQDLPEAETHVSRSNSEEENPYAEHSSTNFRPSLKAAIFTSLNLEGTRDSMTESQVASS